MAKKLALVVKEAVVVARPPAEAFELFADPELFVSTLELSAVTIRKLGHAERWVMGHPEKLGDKVIDLSLREASPPDRLTWLAALRGFEVETILRFEAHQETSTRIRLFSAVEAKSLRAKLMSPLLKLAERRLRRGVRRSLRQVARKLHAV